MPMYCHVFKGPAPPRPSAQGLWPRWGHAHPSWSFWALPFLCDLLYERWPPQRLEWPRVAFPKKRPGRPNVVIVLVNMQVHVHSRHCNQDISSKVAKYQLSGPELLIYHLEIKHRNGKLPGFWMPLLEHAVLVFRPFPRWNSHRKISPCLQVPRRLQTWQDRGGACALRSSLGHISSGLIKDDKSNVRS
jgi:hypothetical protein